MTITGVIITDTRDSHLLRTARRRDPSRVIARYQFQIVVRFENRLKQENGSLKISGERVNTCRNDTWKSMSSGSENAKICKEEFLQRLTFSIGGKKKMIEWSLSSMLSDWTRGEWKSFKNISFVTNVAIVIWTNGRDKESFYLRIIDDGANSDSWWNVHCLLETFATKTICRTKKYEKKSPNLEFANSNRCNFLL